MIYRKKQYLGDEEEKLSTDIIYGDKKFTQTQINEQILNQIPTYTATGTVINVKDSSNLPIKDFVLLGNASQNGTPTPDSPVPISVVTGDNTLYFRKSRNLFNENDFLSLEDWTKDNEGYTGATSKLYTTYGPNTNGFITIIPNAQYTVSMTAKVSTSGGNGRIEIIYSDDSYDEFSSYINTTTFSTYTLTSNPAKTISKIVFVYGGNRTITIQKFQIEIGNIATEYEPYSAEQQTQLISLGDIELARIPNTDYKDRIFHAVQGDDIYDSLDSITKATLTVGSWYKQGNINKMTLPTKSSLSTGPINTVSTQYALFTNSSFPMRAVGATKMGEFISDRNVFLSPEDTTFSAYPAYRVSNVFVVVTSPDDTLENFNSKIAGTTLYYVLATPTYTEITDTTLIAQLDNVLAMNTYKNETNAFSIVASGNQEGDLQIEYYQDIATLINDLRTAFLSLGNNV